VARETWDLLDRRRERRLEFKLQLGFFAGRRKLKLELELVAAEDRSVFKEGGFWAYPCLPALSTSIRRITNLAHFCDLTES